MKLKYVSDDGKLVAENMHNTFIIIIAWRVDYM